MLTLVPDFQVIEFSKLKFVTFHNSNRSRDKSNNVKKNQNPLQVCETLNHVNNLSKSSTTKNIRSYLRYNYPTWNASRQKHVANRQVIKCASCRDVGQQDMSFTLSSSSSYMSDSRTTNICQCDNNIHQQCRYLLDESLDRGSSECCEVPPSTVKETFKLRDNQLCNISSTEAVRLCETSNVSEISLCFPETA